jgi:hypothetical protein
MRGTDRPVRPGTAKHKGTFHESIVPETAMMTMFVAAALLATTAAASATDDLSPFYRTPYAQVTAEAAARAAVRSAPPGAEEQSRPHRDCVKCGCDRSRVEKASPEKK